ncbi:protein OSB1, mitochondrial-like isoform X1 [Primulina tabacum]|uniref:protein OSB1, mitochondrial-like isoform X1 n=1 Tax=Primulina tabacum TaxID=48773 RepID=UPI003F5A48C7
MGVARLLLRRFENGACSSPLFRIPRFFSTSAAMIQRPWIYDLSELEESIDESTVYRRTLKFQRPTTVRFQANMLNSASLIGFISAPFKNYDTASGRIGVYTSLKVDSPARAYRNFMVMLDFWDDLAEIAVEHLKLRDLIYISGSLVSYKVMDEDGKSIHRHKVRVAEVNLIVQHATGSSCQNSLKLKPKVTAEEILQMHKARLLLWQVFFSSSDEWWDNRNNKRNPNQPDFRHKDTGEALWLKDTDPPWVKKQLLLHDSRLNKRGSKKHINAFSHLSPFVFDDTPGN